MAVYENILAITRVLLPILALLLVLSWVLRFMTSRPAPRVLAKLITADGYYLPITVAEGFIGRKKNCDIQIPVATVSKKHALLFQNEDNWWIRPLGGAISINGAQVRGSAMLQEGDRIGFGSEVLTFSAYVDEDENQPAPSRFGDGWMLLVLTIFQGLMAGQLCLRYIADLPMEVPLSFGLLMAGEWVYYIINRAFGKTPMLCEVPVLFLTTLGLAVCTCAAPSELMKQMICLVAGVGLAGLLVVLIRHEEWCYKIRYVVATVTLGVLWFTAVFGISTYGSRNWLSLGGISVQPSEFAKAAFLLVGGCALYITVEKPANRWFFMLFAGLTLGSLVLMVDFGAVLIFFITMLIILAMRFTAPWLIAGMAAGATAVGGLFLLIYPHIANRFGAWLHVWEYADTIGYQQTRTLLYSASGGMLGVGGGNGYLLDVAASDTDLVFGVLCEEWGGIVALCAALCFVALAVYARRLAANTRSSFQAIGVCAAAGMMLMQTALNIFGSTDILPLTGVTMMFVSRGGSSLIAAFMLIAFFKGAEATPHELMIEGRPLG